MKLATSGAGNGRGGFSLFLSQLKCLLKKNAVTTLRGANSPVLRFGASIFFILVIYLTDLGLQAQNADYTVYKNVFDPKVRSMDKFPDCSEDLYIKDSASEPCFNILFAPQSDPFVQEIMDDVHVTSATAKERFLGFEDAEAIDAFLRANRERVMAAVNINVTLSDDGKPFDIAYDLQTNSSVRYWKSSFQDANFYQQVPVQVAIERASARLLSKYKDPSSEAFDWTVGVREFAHPAMKLESQLAEIASPFLFAAAMFNFVAAMTSLASERESGLRQGMKNAGMMDSAYWISWSFWETVMNALTSMLVVITGMVFGFRIFTENNFGLTFLLYFLFQQAMSSVAFIQYLFINKTQEAVSIGFFIYFIGYIFQIVVTAGFPYDGKWDADAATLSCYIIFSFLPWNLLAKGLKDLSDATAQEEAPGIRWNERFSYCRIDKDYTVLRPGVYTKFDCSMSLGEILCWLLLSWIGYFLIAFYLDNVVPNEYGNCKHPLFFLLPSYWRPGSQEEVKKHLKKVYDQHTHADGAQRAASDSDVNQDVADEKTRLLHVLGNLCNSSEAPEATDEMAIFGLQKTYKKVFGKSFEAVKGVWFSAKEGQVFCLLGPNGAGKTTSINCLIGALNSSGGDALMYGHSMKYQMDRIRTFLGICPQHDLLWDELSGREHVEIFGLLKGLTLEEARVEADDKLRMVNLIEDADLQVGKYSGGMRRRVSFAISLINDPNVLFLDEPTTGLDPITRRHIWSVIQECARGKVIVLTTHSMEEADILGDRIAILAKGNLQCIGSSIRLKTQFGSGYKVIVQIKKATGEAANQVQLYQEVTVAGITEEVGRQPISQRGDIAIYSFDSASEGEVKTVLEKLEARKVNLDVESIQLSLSTLEEVFLNVAKGGGQTNHVLETTGILSDE